jgi:hypothetical protein
MMCALPGMARKTANAAWHGGGVLSGNDVVRRRNLQAGFSLISELYGGFSELD